LLNRDVNRAAAVFPELGSSELFPGVIAGASLFLKKITDAVASYHQFTATAIRYFGVSGGQRKKFARVLPSTQADSNSSSHCFALILNELFAVR